MFDRACPQQDWYYYDTEIIRVVGSNLAPMDRVLFDKPQTVGGNCVYDEWLESNTVNEPHAWFYFNYVQSPPRLVRGTNFLNHHRNCSHPALELFWRMGVKRIHLYGVELSSGEYALRAMYTNFLIERIIEAGCEVYRTPSNNSALHAAKWLR
jgi:hypothetical protein